MTQVLNNQTINNNQGGANMNEKELKDAVIALQTLVQANKDQYVDLIKRAYDTSVKPLVQTSNVAGVVNIKGLDFAVNTDGDVVLKKDELENLFNTVLAATQQPVAQPQVPQFNFNTNGVIDNNVISQAVNQAVNQVQQPVATQAQQDRAKLLADEMTKLEATIRSYTQMGLSCNYEMVMYNKCKAEFDSLMGTGLFNSAINTAQTVATNVSNYTANTVAPTVGGVMADTTDLITGFLNGVLDLGKQVWNEAAPIVSTTVNAGFNVAQSGVNFAGQQLNNTANFTQTQIVSLSQLGNFNK